MWMIKALAVLFIFFLLGLLYSSLPVKVTHYEITDSRISNPVKIVFLSDLHSAGAASGNPDLVRKVTEQKPDVIALVGDMIDDNSTESDAHALVGFITSLMKAAPVYYSMGNDEFAYMRKNGRSVFDALATAGATLLDETDQDISVNGNQIRIGGLYALAFSQKGKAADTNWQKTSGFLTRFGSTGRLKIMLCHRPDSFIFNGASHDWNVDLILSGHTHGGLIRLPFLGGLLAAGQGLRPAYDYGRYQLNHMTMIITSGISGYKTVPRIWNRKEIAVLQLRNSG